MASKWQRPTSKDGESSKLAESWKDLKWKLQPEAYNARKLMISALERSVDSSSNILENEHDIVEAKGWISDLFDEETYEKLFATEHIGNFVIVRSTGKRDFEEMPIYARIGMHLLFYGPVQIRLLNWKVVRNLLKEQSIRQGKIYDEEGPDVVKRIEDFIKTYEIDMNEVLIKKPEGYKTFNEFFSRKLKPGARPPASPKDPSVIVSAADCRLNVFESFDIARRFWVKGKLFTVTELLGSLLLAAHFGLSPSLSIFRLAPQDYHRFHSPVDGTIESITSIPGEYYTVNPQAVNQTLNVLTGNRRDVMIINAKLSSTSDGTVPVAFVAIGALLVASINWSKKVGETVTKGEDLGWFAYGGSTVVTVFATSANVKWDDDLLKASHGEWTGEEDPKVTEKIPEGAVIGTQAAKGEVYSIEVLLKAGEKIGVANVQPSK